MALFGAYLLVLLLVFTFGSAIGSFMNVVIYRLPLGKSPAAGRSYCPQCEHTLAPLDMVPVLSWLLLLRGHCRYCNGRISPRYPLVELAGGLLAVAMAWRFGLSVPMLLGFAVSQVAVGVALIDHDTMTIPDGLCVALAVVALATMALGDGTPLWSHLAGAVAVSLPLWLVNRMVRDAFGGGDIKLMAAAGLYLGLPAVLVAFFVALLLGGSYGIWLMAVRGARGKRFAFGPYLAAGIVLGTLWGQQLADWYVSFLY